MSSSGNEAIRGTMMILLVRIRAAVSSSAAQGAVQRASQHQGETVCLDFAASLMGISSRRTPAPDA